MAKKLIIVESPTKAKTLNRFLGKEYNVLSSFGHIRDLPKSKMGIDIDDNFEPQYVIPKDKQKQVTALKKAAAKADIVYFATDEDREGEAISWHLAEILALPKKQTKRIAFHEITEEAVKHAIEHPRDISQPLVDAQQARRILDRLVGYELSPLLWRKVARGLSAGRVQSVALRLIAEREREIEIFKPQEYWSLEVDLATDTKENLTAKLTKAKGKKIEKLSIENQAQADAHTEALNAAVYQVAKIQKKQTKKSPLPPFITSTLQQEANRRFGFSSKQTMRLAQQLYEGVEIKGHGSIGLITYMRTDSTNLATKFTGEAHEYLVKELGKNYALESPRHFKKKAKLAQEAHEAIRPTDVLNLPENIKNDLEPRQWKLYDLIWRRAVASQMPQALIDNTGLDIVTDNDYELRATGQTITFNGYLKIYQTETKESLLPTVKEGATLTLQQVKPEQHFTQPPARYSEATLIKVLEEKGIGRPSTYAPTIGTLEERNYIVKEEKRLKPTDIALTVSDLLVEHFPRVVDYEFTAKMEEDLDEVAAGKKTWQPTIKEFYEPFHANLEIKDKEISKKEVTEEKTDITCEKCGSPMVIKLGRFGKFLACSNYPECKNTKPLNEDGEKPEAETVDEKCPECGQDLVVKQGRFGKFIGCSGYPECKYIKSMAKTTGVKCPECGEGEIVEKRSRRGKTFYACNRYPDCKYALWSKPTGDTCPKCHSLMVYAAKDKIRCSNKECGHTATAE